MGEHYMNTIGQEELKRSPCRQVLRLGFRLYGFQMENHSQHKKVLKAGDTGCCLTVGGIDGDLFWV